MTIRAYYIGGIGDYVLLQVPRGSVHKSDMLPAGWSDGNGAYSLMYQRNDQFDTATYLLKVISVEGMLLVHLLVSEY